MIACDLVSLKFHSKLQFSNNTPQTEIAQGIKPLISHRLLSHVLIYWSTGKQHLTAAAVLIQVQ